MGHAWYIASCIMHHDVWPIEVNLKNDDNLKNEDDLKNENNLKNEDNLKK